MVCPFLVERPVSHRLQEWRARRYWSLWFVGKVLLLNLFRSAFRVRDIEFYFTQHVSSITVEQRWHFPGCFQSVLYVQINSSLTHTKENCLRCVNVCPSIKRGGGSSVSYEAWVFFNQRIDLAQAREKPAGGREAGGSAHAWVGKVLSRAYLRACFDACF